MKVHISFGKGDKKVSDLYMSSDMQYKDSLRKDNFMNELIIKAIKDGDIQLALEYLEQNRERIKKALEE